MSKAGVDFDERGFAAILLSNKTSRTQSFIYRQWFAMYSMILCLRSQASHLFKNTQLTFDMKYDKKFIAEKVNELGMHTAMES